MSGEIRSARTVSPVRANPPGDLQPVLSTEAANDNCGRRRKALVLRHQSDDSKRA